jgi:hypothetical protein
MKNNTISTQSTIFPSLSTPRPYVPSPTLVASSEILCSSSINAIDSPTLRHPSISGFSSGGSARDEKPCFLYLYYP